MFNSAENLSGNTCPSTCNFVVYRTCLADPDLWMRPMKRLSYVFKHYKYVIFYIDDVLTIRDDPNEVLQKIDRYFGLKPGSLADPNIYLGAS